jgi:hypothetical protein
MPGNFTLFLKPARAIVHRSPASTLIEQNYEFDAPEKRLDANGVANAGD